MLAKDPNQLTLILTSSDNEKVTQKTIDLKRYLSNVASK